MDNQQRKIEVDTSWLAGFIDGEGCFMMRKQAGAYMKRINFVHYRPCIRICNTHMPTLDRVTEILKVHELPVHVSHRKYTNPKYLPAWDVEVAGIKRAAKWLPLLIPFLYTKKEQAELMLEFCESRLSSIVGNGYSTRELAILEYFRRSL